jgi:Holliday junction resolvasome RuvABC DNA-binding subunit
MIPGGKNIAETLYLSLERGAQSARPLASIIKYGQLSENELALLEKSLSRLGLQAKEIEQVLAETLKKYKVEESTAKHRSVIYFSNGVAYFSNHEL